MFTQTYLYHNEDGDLCIGTVPMPDSPAARLVVRITMSHVVDYRGRVTAHPDLSRLRCGTIADMERRGRAVRTA